MTDAELAVFGAVTGLIGALTGIAALVRDITRERHERGRIQTWIGIVDEHSKRVGQPWSEAKVVATMMGGRATNAGRRPVRIVDIVAVHSDNKHSKVLPNDVAASTHAMPAFPHTLEEGEHVDFRVPLELFGEDTIGFAAVDSLGNRWMVDKKTFRDAHARARELLSKRGAP
jgi:hypothetical protein